MLTATMAKKVLVVDDESSDRETLCRALIQAGYQVASAGSAEEALWLLESAGVAPQAIISNIHLPGMDGKSMIHEIMTLRPGVKAVMLTAFANVVDYLDLTKSDAVEYIAKPIHPPQVLGVLERFIGRPEEMPSDYWVN